MPLVQLYFLINYVIMIYCFYSLEYSRVQQEFARSLSGFHFQTIGTEKTEDECQIGE